MKGSSDRDEDAKRTGVAAKWAEAGKACQSNWVAGSEVCGDRKRDLDPPSHRLSQRWRSAWKMSIDAFWTLQNRHRNRARVAEQGS